jgi:hypothetical protein
MEVLEVNTSLIGITRTLYTHKFSALAPRVKSISLFIYESPVTTVCRPTIFEIPFSLIIHVPACREYSSYYTLLHYMYSVIMF